MRANRGVLGVWMGLTAVALLVGFAGAAFAQTTAGTITGTITDAQGAAIANANVVIHNTDTGTDTQAKTNDTGLYTAPLLPPGNYDITASLTGFATVQNKGVRVQVGETSRIDIQMPVASQQSLVTVTTEVPLIETEKTEASQTVSETLVSDLPVSSRRWEQFVMLTPGVVPDGPSGGMTWHGINSMYNGNSVDGANNLNTNSAQSRGGSANDGYVYSGDSIREFQVASSNYNAELGNAGGSVNAVTKSGTSQIHGDLFYNMRNPIFNALDPVVKETTPVGQAPTKSVHQQNQFGGSVGGPILKDKLFYFLTYDGYRKVTPIAYTSSTNIGSLGCPTNTADITAAQCAGALAYINNDNLGIFPRELRQDVALGKIDYQANASNHFNAVFNWRNWFEPNGTAPATSANSGITTTGNSWLQNRFVIATWNKVIGNDKVNQLLYQFGQDNSHTVLRGTTGPSSLTVGGLNANQVPPNVTLSNIFTYGSNSGDPGFSYEDRHQITDSFSFGSGRHAFKVGADLNFIHTRLRAGMTFGGFYQYTNAVALPASVGCPSASGSQGIFCDWLVDLYGVPTTNPATGAVNTGQHWSTYAQIKDQRYPGATDGNPLPNGQQIINDDSTDQAYGMYFQDTWKAKSNLTVNLGIRYDLQILPGPTAPNTSTPLLALYTTKVNIDYGHVGPRLGVAWNVAKNTVIRGGFGVFYGLVPLSAVYIMRISSGLEWQQFNCSPGQTAAPCGGTGYATGLTFPNVLFSQQVSSPGPAAPFAIPGLPAAQQPLTPVIENPSGNNCLNNPTCGTRGIDPKFDGPLALEGEVGIERQLPWKIGLTATYVFTHGQSLPAYWDSNLAPATVNKTYDVTNLAGVTQSTVTLPLYTTRLNPTTGAILTQFSAVASLYNGMILTVRKQASHGFEFLANYTLSRSTDDGQAAFATGSGLTNETYFTGPAILDPYNLKGEQAVSGLNTPNRFAGSVVWAPDYAKKFANKLEKATLDGWILSSTITAANGTPISGIVQSSASVCSLGSNASGTGCTGNGGVLGLDGGMTGTALTTIGQSAGGRIGWMPRDSFTLPSYGDVDLRLEKGFSWLERYNLDFRAEAFNLFNSTIVQAINTNASNYVGAGTGVCAGHVNTCMVPVTAFQSATTTTNILLGARQMQFGLRFSF